MKTDKKFLDTANEALKQLKARLVHVIPEKGLVNFLSLFGENALGENGEREYYQKRFEQFVFEIEHEKLRMSLINAFWIVHLQWVFVDEGRLHVGIQNEENFELFKQYCEAFEGYILNKLGRRQGKVIEDFTKKLLDEGDLTPIQSYELLSEVLYVVKTDIVEAKSIGEKIPTNMVALKKRIKPLFEHLQNIKGTPLPAKKLPKPKGKKTSKPIYHSLKPAQIEALYEALKGEYIASDITSEQFQALFDSKVTEMVTPIQWTESNRLLVYLLEKIFKRWQSYFERKKAFVNQNGKLLTASDYSTALNDSKIMGFPIGFERIDKIFETIRK